MKYIHDTTKQQLEYHQVQALFPNTSLPVNGSGVLASIWYLIHTTTQPEYDIYTQKVIEQEPVKTGDIYNQVWQVEALTQQEIDDNLAQIKEQKYFEIDEYSSQLIDEANANPYVGKVTSASNNKKKVASRINHSSNGKPKDPIDSDRDDFLADYTDGIMDSDDSARDIVENESSASIVAAMDVLTMVIWSSWTPPI